MNRYKLNPEDIIKIGRITLRIRDIHFSNNKKSNSVLNESNITNIKEMNILKTEGELGNNINMDTNKKGYNSEKEKIKPIIMTKNSKKENNIFTKLEKKIIFVEYVIWKKKMKKTHYFNHVYAQAQ